MAWLDWARPDLLPDSWHAGYGFLNIPPEVSRDKKFGIIWHSAAGFWSPPGYTPQDLMRSRGNSWDGTVMTDGEVWKHRPRPTFVNWHGGGPAQNLLLGGFEVEGTGPWTPAQRRSILRVNVETHRYFGWERARLGSRAPDRSSQDSIRGTIALVGKGGNNEHTWLSYTTCPDGRDDWAWLIAETNRQLQGGEENDMLRFVKITGSNTVYATDGIFYWTVRDNDHLQEMIDAGLAKPGSAVISQGLFSRLKESHGPSEAGGPTMEEIAAGLTLKAK